MKRLGTIDKVSETFDTKNRQYGYSSLLCYCSKPKPSPSIISSAIPYIVYTPLGQVSPECFYSSTHFSTTSYCNNATYASEFLSKETSTLSSQAGNSPYFFPFQTSFSQNTLLGLSNPSLELVNPSLEMINPSLELANPSLELINPSLELINPSLDLVNPSLELTNPSLEMINPSLELTNPSTCFSFLRH